MSQPDPSRDRGAARVGRARGRGAARRGRRRRHSCALFIDHPDGVTLDLCERVTEHLAEVRERYALEVSSPGTERPLTKPDHFRRFVGRRATRAHARATTTAAARFTGELLGATDDEVTVAADTGVVSIALRRHPPFEPRRGD